MIEICNFSAVLNYSDPANYDYFENCTAPGGNGGAGHIGPQKVQHKDVETSFKLLLYIIAFLQNILLLYVILRDPMKRFRNPPSYFIANFTIADTLSIVSGMCDSVFQLNPREHYEKQEVSGCLQGIGIQASFVIIIIFAFDRHLAIGHPFTYRNLLESKITLVVLLVFPWCLGTIILPIIYFSPSHGPSLTKLFAGDIIALTCITLVVNPLTYFKFRGKMKTLTSDKQHSLENLKIERVLATTVVMVSISLILFMFPYFIAFCFHVSDCTRCFLNKTFLSFWTYYPLLTAIRLLTNSAIYAWRLPLYWQSLKLLTRVQRIRGSSGSNQSNGTQSLNSSINATPLQPRFEEGGLHNKQVNKNSFEMKDQTPRFRETENNKQIGDLGVKEQSTIQQRREEQNSNRNVLEMKDQTPGSKESDHDRQNGKDNLGMKEQYPIQKRNEENEHSKPNGNRNNLEMKEQIPGSKESDHNEQKSKDNLGMEEQSPIQQRYKENEQKWNKDNLEQTITLQRNVNEDELNSQENSYSGKRDYNRIVHPKENYGLQDTELYNEKNRPEKPGDSPKLNKQPPNEVRIDMSTSDTARVFDEKF